MNSILSLCRVRFMLMNGCQMDRALKLADVRDLTMPVLQMFKQVNGAFLVR